MVFRKVVKFLDSPRPGMYRQKALDLRMPATLPKHILLDRTRGIEEVETESKAEAKNGLEDDMEVEDGWSVAR